MVSHGERCPDVPIARGWTSSIRYDLPGGRINPIILAGSERELCNHGINNATYKLTQISVRNGPQYC